MNSDASRGAPDEATRWPPVFVDEDIRLDELSRSLRCEAALLVMLVHEGVLEPQGESPDNWHFAGASLQRARRAVRLVRDLEINPPGVALALDLLEQITRLEAALAGLRDSEGDAR
jgi:chaperone modulatory protein CbpM